MAGVGSYAGPARAPALQRMLQSRLSIRLIQAVIVAGFLALWQIQASSDPYWTMVFSTPELVVHRLATWLPDAGWWNHLGVTLLEAGLGYALGLAIALILVAAFAANPWLARFASPFIGALSALPKIALAPLFIFWFGVTLQAKAYFVASLICFIIFHGVNTGLRTIDRTLVDNMRLFGASRFEMVRDLYVPAIVTWLIGSLRLSSAWALVAAVVGEYLGSNKGIGYLIATGQQVLQTDVVVAGILVAATIAVTLDRLLVVAERAMSKWRAF